MSQTVRISRVSLRGVPVYLGQEHGNTLYSGNPDRVAKWLCDGYRTRFNQHRSNRSKYVYSEGDRLLDLNGEAMLTPIGGTVITITDKQAREQFPHLAAIPAMVLQSPAKIESSEWFAATKRKKAIGGSMPGFRSRKRGDLKFSCWFNNASNAVFHQTGRRSGILVIKGQNPAFAERKGRWSLRFHVRVSQPIRSYTSVQVDMASRRVTFVSPAFPVDRTRASGSVGLDRGVTHAVATSEGEFFDIPSTPELDGQIAHLQKRMAKSRVVAAREGRNFWDSSRYRTARQACADKQRRRAARKNDAVHAFTKRIAETYAVVVLEALPVKSMARKARGKGSAAKRGLNRGIVNSRWSTISQQLQYKTGSGLGGAEPSVFAVNPAYTSQRCSSCGHIASENRESQSEFRCTQCGHEANADINAAINIVDKHQQGWAHPAWSKGKTSDALTSDAPAMKRKPPALSHS